MLAPMLEVAQAVGFAGIAVPEQGLSWATGLGVVATVAVVALVYTRSRLADVHARLAALETSKQRHAASDSAAVAERERKAQKDLEAKREELREQKQELGQLRKKNHALQEEQKKLRDDLREANRMRLEVQNARPAFAEVEERKPAPKAAKAVEKVHVDADVAAAHPVAAPVVAPVAIDPNPELLARLSKIETDKQALETQLHSERQAANTQREELKKLRKRSEDLRRIDVMTKSRMDLMEDKLRGLGRQYYDAISELAAVKGEVVPPRPRELRESEESAGAAHEAAADDYAPGRPVTPQRHAGRVDAATMPEHPQTESPPADDAEAPGTTA